MPAGPGPRRGRPASDGASASSGSWSDSHRAQFLEDVVHEGGEARMRDLEAQYRGLERSGQLLIGNGAVRILDPRRDVDDEAIEALPRFLVADVERANLRAKVTQGIFEMF